MPAFVTLPKSGKDQSDDSNGNHVHSKLRLCLHVALFTHTAYINVGVTHKIYEMMKGSLLDNLTW